MMRQTPFAELMALESINESTYISKTPAWPPGGQGSAFGGHVYAQAVLAASKTVEEGMIVHNVNGYFTLPGYCDRPFVYKVETISDGRSYVTRHVTARQPLIGEIPFKDSDKDKELGNVCFNCICSFKKDEPPQVRHQEVKDWDRQYGNVLKGKRPKDHGQSPEIDAPWFLAIAAKNPHKYHEYTFPGLSMQKVDMSAYNKPNSPLSYRQLTYYRLRGSIPSSDRNLHACAHLYASDRNGLFLIAYALGFPDEAANIGSLSHSVIFHTDSTQFLLPDDLDVENDAAWFCQEAWTPRTEGGRGLHESKMWNSSGVHIASSWQDGLVRKVSGNGAKEKLVKMRNDRTNWAQNHKL